MAPGSDCKSGFYRAPDGHVAGKVDVSGLVVEVSGDGQGFVDVEGVACQADLALDGRAKDQGVLLFFDLDVLTGLQGLVAYRIGGELLAPDGESFFSLDSRMEAGQEGAVLDIEFATGFPEIDAAVLVDFAGF